MKAQEPWEWSMIPTCADEEISRLSSSKHSIVAVHGLNGHRERSWTAENGTNWLRDLLPIDMPGVRVASWGWNLLEKGSSFQTISEKLIHDLWELRSSTNVHGFDTKQPNLL